jgi:hypothetical protein
MHRLLSLVLAVSAAGCAAGSARPGPAAARDEAARPAPAAAEEPRGRPAGIEIIQLGGQRTYWVEHCPTDSPSPLREQCSLTRADPDAPR